MIGNYYAIAGSIPGMLLVLTEKMCVVILAAYLIVNSKYFQEVLEEKFTVTNQVVLAVAFGLLSIYGTYAGIPIMDTQTNIRDLGPMIAGLIGGPVIGIGAGLIGGIHRYTLGGFTQIPCSLSTILAGAFGGMLYLINKKKFVGIGKAAIFAAAIESMHMSLVLLMGKPYSAAFALFEQASVPMIFTNVLGTVIFSYIIMNVIWGKKMALERDIYHDELEKKKVELNIARDIQMNFLPQSIPPVEGYELAAACIPANEVGGDFYDFIKMKDGRLGFVIADVSGKSIPAALYMALSRAVIRSNTLWAGDARSVIKKANCLIEKDSGSGMFVTLFYAVLDGKNMTLTYVNAGHNPPLMLENSTGKIRQLKTKGIALGAIDDAEYEELVTELNHGDMLVLYTDGITEANDTSGMMYGEDRLRKIIVENGTASAAELMEKIKSDVKLFCHTAPQSDDITMMVLKVK